MRRIFKLLFTAFSALSLLLCMLIGYLWVRSYFIYDSFEYNTTPNATFDQAYLDARSYRAYLMFVRQDLRGFKGQTSPVFPPGFRYNRMQAVKSLNFRLAVRGVGRERFGFGYYRQITHGGNMLGRGLLVPHWFFVLLFAVLPAWWITRWRRPHRPGTCPKCGYDLRATPDRCPECGTAVQKAR